MKGREEGGGVDKAAFLFWLCLEKATWLHSCKNASPILERLRLEKSTKKVMLQQIQPLLSAFKEHSIEWSQRSTEKTPKESHHRPIVHILEPGLVHTAQWSGGLFVCTAATNTAPHTSSLISSSPEEEAS